ncbi:MAG: hypothetical protein KAI71_01110 [Candidatus Pacebacteria bacterium]|nr:hypothetical protein [Candidatus Paceibacterota bacterium]
MKKKYKSLILIAIIALILPSILQSFVYLFSGACGGSFGLRPTAHLCVGVEIDSEKTIRKLPSADIDFHILFFHFGYRVDEKNADWSEGFCLGQDIWYGE